MMTWSVQNAKAKFSELLAKSIQSEPQIVTKHGQKVAVVLSIEEWERLKSQSKPSLKQLLLTESARFDLPDIRQEQHNKVIKRRELPNFD